MKFYFVFIFTFFAFCEISKSVDIDCKFGHVGRFSFVGSMYLCTLNNPYIRSQEYVKINKITGTHEGSMTNDDVNGFYASEGHVINYFPQGFDEFFKNIKLIAIYQSQLKEIHQSDLKPFPKLIYLNLYSNYLEILEEGLFDFNPDLEIVGLHINKITHIDSNIFNNLKKLRNLWFDQVPCINKNSPTSAEVQDSIRIIKAKCTSSEFTSLNEQITKLESESKTLSSDEFSTNLDSFEKIFNASKFSKFRPLNYKFENLKILRVGTTPTPLVQVKTTTVSLKNDLTAQVKAETCTNCCQINDISDINLKIGDSVSNLKASQDHVINSLENLTSKFTEREISHDKMKASISDIEVTLSDVKIFQNEVLSSFSKLKTSQNEIKLAVNDIRSSKADNSEEKNSNLNENLETLFVNFETKAMEKIEMEMSNTRHKMSINIDEKIKGIEKRLMKKFEDILEEKMVQVLAAVMKN